MEKLRKAIQYKDKWNLLVEEIDDVERFKTKSPAKALELAKSALETISLKIAQDRGISFEDSPSTGSIVKKAFASLPVIRFLNTKDTNSSKAILNAVATIATQVGEFRNRYGPVAHGRDLYAEKIDAHTSLFTIEIVDVVAAYLVNLDAFDVTERTRILYEDYPFFNKKLDDEQDDELSVQGAILIPSKALFGGDFDSYREKLIEFEQEKKEEIDGLCNSETFVNTRARCLNLYVMREYLSDDEILKLCKGFAQNGQVNQLIKHGHTKNLFEWITDERSRVLDNEQFEEMLALKDKSTY